MTDPLQPEVLQLGRERRPAGPHALVVRLAVGLLLVVVIGAGVGVDHHVRQRESRRVSSCVAEALGAVRYSWARVDAIAGYVRPTLESVPPSPLRRRLFRIVSQAVAPTVSGVEAARDRCAGVDVLVLHTRLRAVRADCLRLLARDLTYLRGIVADGSRAQLARSLPQASCQPET